MNRAKKTDIVGADKRKHYTGQLGKVIKTQNRNERKYPLNRNNDIASSSLLKFAVHVFSFFFLIVCLCDVEICAHDIEKNKHKRIRWIQIGVLVVIFDRYVRGCLNVSACTCVCLCLCLYVCVHWRMPILKCFFMSFSVYC